MGDKRSTVSSAAAAKFKFGIMEEQFRALQLQPSQINGVFQQVMEERFNIERNIHQYNDSNYFINSAPSMEESSSTMRGVYTSHRNIWSNGYGSSLPYEDYRMMEMASMGALTVTPPRMFGYLHHNNFFQPPWRGWVVLMATDCLECQYLQAIIEEGDPRSVAMILSEIKNNLHELMKHQFGNYLIQKLFEAKKGITNIQIDSIVYLIISDVQKFSDVCKNNHGTRVVQIMLENVRCPFTKYAVLHMMKSIIVELMNNVNGGYVIIQCVIMDELAKNCVDIATHKIGCSVVQTCLLESGILAIDLITSIISNATLLAEDPYGNYVVQFVIKMKFPLVNKRMIAELRGKFAGLSMNKHGSNVVEDLLRCSNQDDVHAIVKELMRSTNFLEVIQDPFGNYVVQRALKCTQKSRSEGHVSLCQWLETDELSDVASFLEKEGLSHSAEAVDNSL
ncbi:hypothetical protein KIW84_065821 [Lathyrus oleraceus]|uniref:PUM-HD domain-containing protein n=1 Tax=Pisum sativum TaxID=3888 RepID=A0A9D5AAW4_PEA|nr:hypothetical protein KIW84_065821 [Pisum sativum]